MIYTYLGNVARYTSSVQPVWHPTPKVVAPFARVFVTTQSRVMDNPSPAADFDEEEEDESLDDGDRDAEDARPGATIWDEDWQD